MVNPIIKNQLAGALPDILNTSTPIPSDTTSKTLITSDTTSKTPLTSDTTSNTKFLFMVMRILTLKVVFKQYA